MRAFQNAIMESNLALIPKRVSWLLDTRAWEGFIFPQLFRVEKHTTLGEFLVADISRGCGFKDIGAVDALVKKACEADLYARWRDEMVGPNDRGSSQADILSRMRRERPDLIKQVEAKELSASAAAIQAGFCKQPSAFDTIVRLLPKLSARERRRLRDMISSR